MIRFGCRQPGASTFVDLIADRVHEITLNGTAIDPAAAAAGRIVLDGLADRNELTVTADCRYSTDGTGLHRAVDSADGKIYTYTKFEPAYARRVFANFEQPDLKAAFTFHVTVPGHWKVLSNQPGARVEPAGDAAGWHFLPTPPISTYLTAVAAGEYHLVTDSHTTPRGQQIPLGLACRASLAEHLDVGGHHADHPPGTGFLHRPVRRRLPIRQVRPGVRARVQRRCHGERRLRDHLGPGAVPLAGDRPSV